MNASPPMMRKSISFRDLITGTALLEYRIVEEKAEDDTAEAAIEKEYVSVPHFKRL